MSLSVRTDAGAPDTYVGGTGLTITGGGATETFDEIKHIQALQKSSTFLALLTDDVYGAGASTLVLVDLSGNDVGQGIAADFLAAIGGPSNVTAAARDSTDPHIIYYGRSSASVGSENPAAAEWQIYRSDDRIRPFTRTYADLDTLFDNKWINREGLDYINYYLATVEPVVGSANIIEGWPLQGATFPGVKGLQNATVTAETTPEVASGAAKWPLSASVARAFPGTGGILCGNPAGGEFDFDASLDSFTIMVWVKTSSSLSSGLMNKQSAISSAGYVTQARVDVNPDQAQAVLRDVSSNTALSNKIDNKASDGNWHLWCFVHDQSVQEWRNHLDKDAPVISSTASVGDLTNTGDLTFGDSLQWGTLEGLYAHAYVLSIALTQIQIDSLYDGAQ